MAKSFEPDAALFSKDKNKKKIVSSESRNNEKGSNGEKLLVATLRIKSAIDVVKLDTSRKIVE